MSDNSIIVAEGLSKSYGKNLVLDNSYFVGPTEADKVERMSRLRCFILPTEYLQVSV